MQKKTGQLDRKIERLINKIKCGDVDYKIGLTQVTMLRAQLDKLLIK